MREIESHLWDLSTRLSSRGEHARIYLFGGAALALGYHARGSTRDIDAVFDGPGAGYVRMLKGQVATVRNIDEDWINEDGAHYMTPQIIAASRILLQMPCLDVFIPPAEALLAMKLVAMRLDAMHSDRQDIVFLLSLLGINDAKTALDHVNSYMPDFEGRMTEMRLEELNALLASAQRPDTGQPKGW